MVGVIVSGVVIVVTRVYGTVDVVRITMAGIYIRVVGCVFGVVDVIDIVVVVASVCVCGWF